MSSSSSDRELEEQLAEAGRILLEPPPAVDELLPLLDRVETYLSRVEQSPSKSMQKALSSSQKALVEDGLFRHADVDVRVAVASCISEITRISAPEAPYDDDQMKEVFQLIVSSFQNLSDKSSRSYVKRASILETVAKVRSCVVMLDLECDNLILEMFEHFLKEIREHHPENVFTSMETIMTLVIEESEDISPELLSPVLASVKKDNEDVLPIAKKLGEKVLEKCAVKLRPYLAQALKSSGVVLDDYSKVIASICQDSNGAAEETNVHDDMEKERLAEEPSTQDVPAPGESPKTVVNNGSTQLDKDDSLVDPVSLNKEEENKESAPKTTDASSNGDLDQLDNKKSQKEESKPEPAKKKRGRRTNMSSRSAKPSNIARVDDKDAEIVKDTEKETGNDAPSLPDEDLKCEAKIPSQSEKEGVSEPSTDKAADDESKDDESKHDESKHDESKHDESKVSALPPLTEEIPDKSQPQEAGSPKDKEDSAEEVKPSSVDISKKESAGTAGLQVETDTKRVDDSTDDVSSKERTITVEEMSKEDDATSGSDVKMLKQPEKKVNASTSSGEGISRKKPEDRRKNTKSRLASEKNVKKSTGKPEKKGTPSSPKGVKKPVKDEKYLGETSKDNFKRKRSSGKEEVSQDSDAKNYGADLIGLKIKVWWPLDKQYYEGVVKAFDSVRKKHKVIYEDGDMEILNLEEEKWKFVEGDFGDKDQVADRDSSDASPEMPLKKKAKLKPGLASAKKVKMDMPSKKSGGVSSGKSKAPAATTSGHKSREGRKTDGNFEKDRTPKSTGKATLKTSGKAKETELMTLKTGKSKANDSSARSVPTKSDREIQKGDKSMRADKSTSKGKGPRSFGKANTSSSGKLKLGSPKPKEDEIEDDDSEETPEVPLSKKARLSESSKAQGGKSSTGKKRRKGA